MSVAAVPRAETELEREDIYQASRYGAWLANEQTSIRRSRMLAGRLRWAIHAWIAGR